MKSNLKYVWILSLTLLVSSCWLNPLFYDIFAGKEDSDNSWLLAGLSFGGTTWAVESDITADKPTVILCGSNHVYIGGIDNQTGQRQWRIEKRNKVNGALDTTFGTNGVILEDPDPSGDDYLNDMLYDGTYLYAVGSDTATSGNYSEWRIEKRLASDGSLVSGFGSGGIVQENPTATSPDYLQTAAIASGYLYLGGSSSVGSTLQQWRLERRDLATGALDSGFGSGGIVLIPVASNGTQTRIWGMATDSTFMYLSGADRSSNVEWRVDKRFLSDASLVSSFGAAGTFLDNPGSGLDQAEQIAIDSTGVFFGGTNSVTGGVILVDKVDISTGIFDAGFGSGGILSENPNPSSGDSLTDLMIHGSNLYMIATDYSNNSDNQWRIERRDTATGTPDISFGDANGIVQSNPTSENDDPTSMCNDGTYLYVAGRQGTTDARWRIEKRRLSDGSL